MEINFVIGKDLDRVINRSFLDKIFNKYDLIIEEYKFNKITFFLNLLRFRLPKSSTLGIHIPPNRIYINVEMLHKHFGASEQKFINKTIRVIGHEILHHEIGNIDKNLIVKQHHWAIKKMGYCGDVMNA